MAFLEEPCRSLSHGPLGAVSFNPQSKGAIGVGFLRTLVGFQVVEPLGRIPPGSQIIVPFNLWVSVPREGVFFAFSLFSL